MTPPAVVAPPLTPVFRAAAVPASVYAPSQGRSTGLRVVMTLGIFASLTMLRLGLPVIGALLDAVVFGVSDQTAPFSRISVLAVNVSLFAALGVACTKVGYRGRDWLFALIPAYGVAFVIRIIWRLTNLPHRGWPERHDQLTATWWAGPAPLAPAPVPVGGAGRFGS